mgnify:CR=1 FL=1
MDHKGGDGGGTGNKGDQEEPEQPFVAHITPVDKLNQGVPVINSHADVTSRSSLKMNFRTYSQLGESVLKSAKPNYVRVKKLANDCSIRSIRHRSYQLMRIYQIQRSPIPLTWKR